MAGACAFEPFQHAAEEAHWAATGTRGMRLMPRPRDRESNMKSHTGFVRLASCMHLNPARDAILTLSR